LILGILAGMIMAVFWASFSLVNKSVVASASRNLYRYPQDEEHIALLIKQADIGPYRTKRGKNVNQFSDQTISEVSYARN
jgi:hypothetical protein